MAYVGSSTTFSVVFTDTAGTAADPATVTFWVREAIDSTELEWTYNASAVEGTHYPTGMNPIVKDSTGNYHVIWVNRKPERLEGFWAGSGTVDQTALTTVFVRRSGIEAVDGV